MAAQVLVQQGAGLAQIRKRVLALLSGLEPSAVHASRRTPGAEEAMRAAEQLAAGAPMGSQHLLEALARSEGSAAARALAALGIDPDRLAAAIDEIELEGTTDLTAEAATVRKAELRLVGDEAHLVLRDSVTVGLVRDVTSELGVRSEATTPSFAGWSSRGGRSSGSSRSSGVSCGPTSSPRLAGSRSSRWSSGPSRAAVAATARRSERCPARSPDRAPERGPPGCATEEPRVRGATARRVTYGARTVA